MEIKKIDGKYTVKTDTSEDSFSSVEDVVKKLLNYFEEEHSVENIEIIPRNGKTFMYGLNKTIHSTNTIDISLDQGEVVGVWFRCLSLPFRVFGNGADESKVKGSDFKIHGILAENTEGESE